MKKIFSIILASFAMVSCIDTVLLPQDKIVEEDFWKTKSDVEAMVNGAYTSFAAENVMKEIIIWTSRSDELNFAGALTGTVSGTNTSHLKQIEGGTVQTENQNNSWAALYSVINNCNLVIAKSGQVQDPNYTQGDNNNNIGQMKALRALAYFYLIRTFRDVPLIEEPYTLSSQEFNVAQTAPSVVLDAIIRDLEEAKSNVLVSSGVNDWQRCGKITSNGVYAILADAYLWRASITGSKADYDSCIRCCDYIRDHRYSVSSGHTFRPVSELDDDTYSLNNFNSYDSPFKALSENNDEEILLQLMFTNNSGLAQMYNASSNNISSAKEPFYYTNSVYSKLSTDDNHVFNLPNSSKDVRGVLGVYSFNDAEEQIRIRKYVIADGDNMHNWTSTTELKPFQYSKVSYSPFPHSWVLYRVTDIMLMKAEAMVQKAKLIANESHVQSLLANLAAATTEAEKTALLEQLEPVVSAVSALNVTAVRQAQITNTRARIDGKDGTPDIDSTKYVVTIPTELEDRVNTVTSYLSVNNVNELANNLEILVMNERARELCFEAKRWYDMLRYNYRHVSGVRYNALLADQAANLPANFQPMLDLMARKYTGNGKAVTSRFKNEAYLYFPIAESETKLNKQLKQNPVYKSNSTAEKNY